MNNGSDVLAELPGMPPAGTSSRASPCAQQFAAHCSEVVVLVGPEPELLRRHLRGMAGVDVATESGTGIPAVAKNRMDVSAHNKRLARTGYMMGGSALLPVYNALMNVMLPALYHHRGKTFAEVANAARELLRELDDGLDVLCFPYRMSPYQRRLTQLARSLILKPVSLFVEDPFVDLTLNERERFTAKLMAMRGRTESGSLVLNTDDPGCIRHHADRFIFISRGCIGEYPGWEAFAATSAPEAQRYLRGIL
jgi:predicted ABC-type transport system involved in lysophospholipase L1 biosynthesis ATPase subunit